MIIHGGLDEIWPKVDGIVDEMPQPLIDEHAERLKVLFTRRADEVSDLVSELTPEDDKTLKFVEDLKAKIDSGDLREALRELAMGVLHVLPDAWTNQQTRELYKRLYAMDHTDKAVILLSRSDKNDPGILGATIRVVFRPEMDLDEIYAGAFAAPD